MRPASRIAIRIHGGIDTATTIVAIVGRQSRLEEQTGEFVIVHLVPWGQTIVVREFILNGVFAHGLNLGEFVIDHGFRRTVHATGVDVVAGIGQTATGRVGLTAKVIVVARTGHRVGWIVDIVTGIDNAALDSVGVSAAVLIIVAGAEGVGTTIVDVVARIHECAAAVVVIVPFTSVAVGVLEATVFTKVLEGQGLKRGCCCYSRRRRTWSKGRDRGSKEEDSENHHTEGVFSNK